MVGVGNGSEKIRMEGGRSIIYEYEWIRLVAMLAVVVGHSCYMGIGFTKYQIPVDAAPAIQWSIFKYQRWLSGFVCTFHMPLFFMISGAVFAHQLKTKGMQPFKQFVSKKAKRLIVPYAIYGILFMIPIKLWMGWYSPNTMYGKEALSYLINGSHSGHLWFLFSLFYVIAISWVIVNLFGVNGVKSIVCLLLASYFLSFWGLRLFSLFPHQGELKTIFTENYLISFCIGISFGCYYDQIVNIFRKKSFIPLVVEIVVLFVHVGIFKSGYRNGALYASFVFLEMFCLGFVFNNISLVYYFF